MCERADVKEYSVNILLDFSINLGLPKINSIFGKKKNPSVEKNYKIGFYYMPTQAGYTIRHSQEERLYLTEWSWTIWWKKGQLSEYWMFLIGGGNIERLKAKGEEGDRGRDG